MPLGNRSLVVRRPKFVAVRLPSKNPRISNLTTKPDWRWSRRGFQPVVTVAPSGAALQAPERIGMRQQHLERKIWMVSHHLPCCVLAAAWAVTLAAASQTPPVESDQQVLIKLERSWNEAFYRRDAAF